MVYLTHKTSRGQRYYYLVKSYKQEGAVGKVQEYLGQTEPSKRELEKLKREMTPDMEMEAIRRMAKSSVEQYNPPFLDNEQTYSLERLRLLNRTMNRMDSPENRIMNEWLRLVNSVKGNLVLSNNNLSGKFFNRSNKFLFACLSFVLRETSPGRINLVIAKIDELSFGWLFSFSHEKPCLLYTSDAADE